MVQTEFLSVDDAYRICETDGLTKSECVGNQFQVYYACNSWLFMLTDLSVPTNLVLALRDALLCYGLKDAVAAGSSLTDELLEGLSSIELSGTPEAFKWAKTHAADRSIVRIFADMADYFCCTSASTVDATGVILQSFIYLERFTYRCSSDEDSAYAKFLAVNARCRDIHYSWPYDRSAEESADPGVYPRHYTWPGQAVLNHLRSELASIFTVEDWHFDMADCNFSSGSAAGPGRYLHKKWEAIARIYPGYKGFLDCPLPVTDTNQCRTIFFPTLMAVPKKLDSRRVIAPEDVASNFVGGAILEALRRMLRANGTMDFINEEDQSVNRALAGYSKGGYATIDMSSASDSISRKLFFEVIPPAFIPMYTNLTSYMCRVPDAKGGRLKKLFCLFTSGNRVTWLTEAALFLAIARVGTSLAGVPHAEVKCFSYGDDILVPAAAYDTVVELLECLGFSVNRRKSYGHGIFRESCGGWFADGVDVTPRFWPRRIVDLIDLPEVLCNMQHKFFEYENTRRFFEAGALTLCHEMTYSPYGDECADLWSTAAHHIGSELCSHWRPADKRRKNPVRTPLIEAVVYYEYLQYGPMYTSGLDRLLRVSESRFEKFR